MRRGLLFLAPLACVLLAPTTALAAHWDLVYVDSMVVQLCPTYGCEVDLIDSGYALLVNKGATDITLSDLLTTSYSCVSSEPTIQLLPFLSNPYYLTPDHPQEAVGSTPRFAPLLVDALLPGETFLNAWPQQTFAFGIWRAGGTYEGPVRFDVTMTMGGEVAQFSMHADIHLAPAGISFLHATRTSASAPTPTAQRSWGRLKARYR